MRLKITGIVFLLLWSITCVEVWAQNQDSRAGDEQALHDLYVSTDGDNWYNNTGWNGGNVSLADSPVGVTVETVNGELRVTAINMQAVRVVDGQQLGNNLTGTLPESIGNLKKVEILKLKTNNLTGQIPSSIGNMVSLRWLSLGGQRCDLKIEDHQWNENNHRGCASGKEFEETNTFTGPIPPEIGNLTNLEVLEIRRQYLTGTLPLEIGNCTNLIGVFLNGQKGDNPLGGALPPEWGNLANLKHLHLDHTHTNKSYTGQVPQEWLIGMKELRHVRLRNHHLEGPLPIFDTYDLRLTDFSYNNFTGGFPIEYFQGKNGLMTQFLAGFNNLSGDISTNFSPPTVPYERTNYHSMSKFGFPGNDFTGPIPDWIQDMAGHQVWDFNGNNLSGAFPDIVMEQGKLKTFMFADNDMRGTLPDKPWASSRMLTIYAQGNGFTGSIPDSWQTLTNSSNRMLYLFLHDNKLEGEIPGWLADITGINRIYLYDNKYTPKDILPHRDAISSTTNAGEYKYLPQKPFGRRETAAVGTTIDRSSFAYTGNTYQWYKDGTALSGETAPTVDTGTYGEGIYTLQIRHPEINYTFESEPIEVTADGTTNQPPETPSLNAPSDGATGVSTAPTLDWNGAAGAETYRVQLAGSSDFSTLVTDQSGLTATQYDVSGLNTNSTYYWRVRAANTNGTSGWSTAWSFTTASNPPDAPTLASPADGATGTSTSPAFEWNPAAGADSYRLLVADDQSFSSIVADRSGITTTSTSVSGLDNSTTHYWKVLAVNSGGSTESTAWNFTTEDPTLSQPQLADPPNGSAGQPLTLTLTWEAVSNADSYNLQVATDNNFQTTVISQSGINDTTFTGQNLDNSTTYYWRIRAVNSEGQSAWSNVWNFTTEAGGGASGIPAPVQISPADGSTNTVINPTFEWEPVSDAEYYILHVSGTNPSEMVIEEQVSGTTFTPQNNLETERTHHWRVRAVKDGTEGNWSPIWEFTTGTETASTGNNDGNDNETSLEQNYPNPFNPSTQIRFTLAESQDISLKIFDTAGRLIVTLVDSRLQAGTHEVTFQVDNLVSGIYFYQLITENQVLTNKMTLIK